MSHNLEAPRTPNELFRGEQTAAQSEVSRVPEVEPMIAPLGAFSTFVVSEQPQLLTAVRDGRVEAAFLAQRQREVVASLDPSQVDTVLQDPMLARFAKLDVSFALNAATFSGITPPHTIQALNARLVHATGLPGPMTFEEVVRINSQLPFGQMRTFTEGEAGDSERRFYYGHDLMDKTMQQSTGLAAQSIEILRSKSNDGADEVVEFLLKGATNMEKFSEFMRSFMRMSRDHFAIFRQYLSVYPDGTRNASGAFIGMPRLTVRLVGLSPRYEQFLNEGMRYFPIDEQADIQHARELAQQGYYLVALCQQLDGAAQRKVAQALLDVVRPIQEFRLRHLAAVQRFVPQALPDGLAKLKKELAETEEEPILDPDTAVVKGTAGFLPGPLLRNALRMDLRAIETLQVILTK